MIADWSAFLNSAVSEEELEDLRRHGRTGRPLGDETFLGRLEVMVGRALKPKKRGPKPKQRTDLSCVSRNTTRNTNTHLGEGSWFRPRQGADVRFRFVGRAALCVQAANALLFCH